jgi:hypothetical protein
LKDKQQKASAKLAARELIIRIHRKEKEADA